jgi:hypothetical protein
MALIKRRKYEDFVNTNASTLTGTSASPLLLITHPAQGGNDATFLRGRCDFYLTMDVDSSGGPPEAWWSATEILLIAWWSDSGSTAIGATFGTSEHFLGTQQLRPVLTRSVTAPTTDYTVTFMREDPFILETSRKGSGVNLPHFGIGLAIYDPYLAFDGTYTTLGINYVGHLFSLWGAPT